METDIEAEVSSALALIENISIKSSDSGLSEETCWQLFGGPCPEALRKKRMSTVEREESGDLYFSAEDVTQPERISFKNQSLEYVAEDVEANHDVDELRVDSKKEQPSVKEDKSNESNRVLEKFRNFSEVRNSNQSFSNNTQPNDTTDNEAERLKSILEEFSGSKEDDITQEDNEEKKVSSERQSDVAAFERISGSQYRASPQGSVAQQKRSKHSVNSQKSRSSSSSQKHTSKTQYSNTVMEEQVRAHNSESSRVDILLNESSTKKNGSNVSVESVNMRAPEKTFSDKSNQVDFLHDQEQQTVGVSKQSSGILEKKDNHVQKNSEDPKVDSFIANREAKSTKEGNINISATTSSVSNEKPIKQIYSSLDSGESSEYDSSIISDLYKRSKCRNDNLCNCRCCVERRIHLTYRHNHSGYDRGNMKNNFKSSHKPFKINIFEDNIPNDYGKRDSRNFIKITSFADNMFDSTVKQCNKRLQTSEINVQEEPLRRYHSVYIPCNRNPLYRDPMYTKPQNAKIPNLRKPTENEFKSCGDFASKNVAQSSTETDSFESDHRCQKNNYTRLEKEAPNIVDSLRSAIKNPNIVRETISKFEERHRSFDNKNASYSRPNICQQKSRFTTADICSCCNRPRNDRSGDPRVPASHLPKYSQW